MFASEHCSCDGTLFYCFFPSRPTLLLTSLCQIQVGLSNPHVGPLRPQLSGQYLQGANSSTEAICRLPRVALTSQPSRYILTSAHDENPPQAPINASAGKQQTYSIPSLTSARLPKEDTWQTSPTVLRKALKTSFPVSIVSLAVQTTIEPRHASPGPSKRI